MALMASTLSERAESCATIRLSNISEPESWDVAHEKVIVSERMVCLFVGVFNRLASGALVSVVKVALNVCVDVLALLAHTLHRYIPSEGSLTPYSESVSSFSASVSLFVLASVNL